MNWFIPTFYLLSGPLKLGPEELKPALDKCTHLIYQPLQISKDFEIQSLRPDIDLEDGFGLFQKITTMKQQFPKLKVLISISGFENLDGQQRYIDVVSRYLYVLVLVLSRRKIKPIITFRF